MTGRDESAVLQEGARPPSYARIIAQGFVGVLLGAGLVLLLAGRWDYWQGWGFAALIVVRMAVGAVVFRDRPELIRERVRPGPGAKGWDVLFYVLYAPASLAVMVVGALDGGRFHWSRPPAGLFFVLGLVLQVIAHSIVIWAMRANAFFSSVVRLQRDRGQRVIDDGPYGLVRHPGNAGGILLAIGMALMLGSWWALVPAGVVAVSLVGRTALEDAALQRELAGYTEYTEKVRHRLVPGVW